MQVILLQMLVNLAASPFGDAFFAGMASFASVAAMDGAFNLTSGCSGTEMVPKPPNQRWWMIAS